MSLRVLTYNIHSGLGRDGIRDFVRIGAFLEARQIDIALLQEVETRPWRTGGLDGETVMRQLMGSWFENSVHAPAVRGEHGVWFGNAILSRFPIVAHEIVDTTFLKREPRNIVDARIQLPGGLFRVLNTHKGLSRAERYSQLEKLETLLAQSLDLPLVVGGDINEWFAGSGMLKRLNAALHLCGVAATFPVAYPVIHLDRIWCRPASLLIGAQRLRTRETKIYSDHYPVLAEFNV